jgi:hypothetical protein
VQAWSPQVAKDVEIHKKVLKKAVTLMSGLKGSTYEEKWEEPGLLTQQERRHQGRNGPSLSDPGRSQQSNKVDKNQWFPVQLSKRSTGGFGDNR